MRVFITGATGFIGMALTRELLKAGHSVLGLARDADKAGPLSALGAEVVMGSLEDPAGLAAAAAQCDAVAHLAFNHDFSKIAQNSADDRSAIDAIGAALKGLNKPLIVTAGLAGLVPSGQVATENDAIPEGIAWPRWSEQAALALVSQDVNAMVMRLPQVHDTAKQGFVSYMIAIAREKGVLAYVGDGHNRLAAGHVSDVAQLYRLALEHGKPGGIYHAAGEEGVSAKAMNDTLSQRLGLPLKSLAAEQAEAHFGWLAPFMGLDMPASSALTRQWLGWNPTGPDLLTDLAHLEI